ncbi:MAG: LiaI-LiaF-like domain-containing protein [Mucilaginibacter sp.]
MRNDRLIPGVVLVLLGGVFLLHNYGYLHFHWMNFVYLWPIFIVIGGVNLIFAHNRSPWATAIKLAVVIAGFGLLLFGNFGDRYHFWPNRWSYQDNNDDSDDNDEDDNDSTMTKGNVTKIEGNSFFNEPFTAAARVARLNVSGGGTTYNLSDTTNQLFTASTREFIGHYDFSHHNEDSVYVLDFKMNKNSNHNFSWGDKDKSNTATLKLNPNPEWEINVEAGATKLDFDLSKFKVRSLKLDGGAASFDVKLGQPLAATKVKVSTGMADVTISIPQNAACRITTDSGLSSNRFDGFNKKGDDAYETPGFDAAKNKIYITIDGAMSSFKVHRY